MAIAVIHRHKMVPLASAIHQFVTVTYSVILLVTVVVMLAALDVLVNIHILFVYLLLLCSNL